MSTFLSQLGRFSARHRLLVIGVWIAIFAALGGVIAVNGMGENAEDTIPSTQASTALEVMSDEFPGAEAPRHSTLQLVFAVDEGAVTDADTEAQISGVLAQASGLPGVESVSDPFDASSPFVSPTGTVAVATLQYGDLDEAAQVASYDAALELQESAPASLGVELGGNLVPLGAPESGPGEALGVLIAFFVLMLTYGSMRMAGANLFVAVFGVGVGLVGILAYGSISAISANSIILAAMLGLAVGIDYSLFIFSRFQNELRAGKSVDAAIGRATGTAGTAVVFAGLTVIVALVALMVANISFITAMGLAGAFGVLIAVLLSLTLVPVFMRTFGLKGLRSKHRKELLAGHMWTEGNQPKKGFLRKWGTFVVKRPVLSLVGGVAVLLVVALPMLGMKTVFSVPGGTDPSSTERTAYDTIVDQFGGVQSPLIVLVEGDNLQSNAATVRASIADLEGVLSVSPPEVSASGDLARIIVTPVGGPVDDSTKNVVHEVRANADATDGVHLEVTGEAAIGIDQDAALSDALIKYVIVIVVISLALMVVMFRSLLIPLLATLGYLLSVFASFGASTAVFQWGWTFPLIQAPQGDPMMSLLPILLVGVLFGLAMDYQVFLVSRIQEMHNTGMAPKEAVIEGFSRSAPVLVAAATIMTVVFAGFASSTFSVAASIAFGLMVGVMADAFIVRLILMPALLSLLGKSAWWIPAWLDKILPNIDVEGHALEAVEESPRVPALV